jgi:hydroxyacylglutathione hydrolase
MSRRRNRNSGEQQQSRVSETQVQQTQAKKEDEREGVVALHLASRNPIHAVTSYVIRGQKHVLVDPGPPGRAGELLEQLSRHRISLGEIGLIVITHGHADQFGSAAQLKEWTRAPVAVHELDAEYVHWGGAPVLKPATRLGTVFRSFARVKSVPVEPDIILRDGDKLSRYGGRGRIISTPGHTAGSISILLPDGACIIGDLLMRKLRAGSPSYPWFAEDLSQVRESLRRVVAAGATTLLPAHGKPFSVADLQKTFPWLDVEVEPGASEPEREERGPRRPRSRRRRHPRREGQDSGGPGEQGAAPSESATD